MFAKELVEGGLHIGAWLSWMSGWSEGEGAPANERLLLVGPNSKTIRCQSGLDVGLQQFAAVAGWAVGEWVSPANQPLSAYQLSLLDPVFIFLLLDFSLLHVCSGRCATDWNIAAATHWYLISGCTHDEWVMRCMDVAPSPQPGPT